MYESLNYCYFLEQLYMPLITDITYSFHNSSLVILELQTVTKIFYAFNECRNLESICLPKLQNCDKSFKKCLKLQHVDCPLVETCNEDGFEGC